MKKAALVLLTLILVGCNPDIRLGQPIGFATPLLNSDNAPSVKFNVTSICKNEPLNTPIFTISYMTNVPLTIMTVNNGRKDILVLGCETRHYACKNTDDSYFTIVNTTQSPGFFCESNSANG